MPVNRTVDSIIFFNCKTDFHKSALPNASAYNCQDLSIDDGICHFDALSLLITRPKVALETFILMAASSWYKPSKPASRMASNSSFGLYDTHRNFSVLDITI